MKVKIIIQEGIAQDVLSTEPVDIEVVDINKDYKDYEALRDYAEGLYTDPALKVQDFTVAHFGEEE